MKLLVDFNTVEILLLLFELCLSMKMKLFVGAVLIVLAAVFCISHVDGGSASEVSEKRQVPLPPVRNQHLFQIIQ